VRPVGMREFDISEVKTWANMIDDKGEPVDFWLRTHERLGAKRLHIAEKSQLVTGTRIQWEAWLGESLSNTQTCLNKTLLQPLKIDPLTGIGEYYDPSIWVAHINLCDDMNGHYYTSLQAIKTYLVEMLPTYMIPMSINFLTKMPTNESGKVAENKLPGAYLDQATIITEAVTDEEIKLVELWCDILKIQNCGVNQDFFQLGGQSLQATRLIFEMKKHFSLELSLNEFYKEPTIIGIIRKATLILEQATVS
jgi:acyl carrier protein